MNLQQLEYVQAVAATGSFSKAAEKCFITQPTLSMMVAKFEEELGVIIFNRKKSPVVPTEAGMDILRMTGRVLREIMVMKEYTASLTGEVSGELRIGVIPTIAPFLLPVFLRELSNAYPKLRLKIFELTTENILQRLLDGSLDIGIAATPLSREGITEVPVYTEEFLVYASDSEKLLRKKYILSKDIDVHHLWLLEDGHCLRSQVLQLCTLRQPGAPVYDIVYETGSIESLIRMVDTNGGVTIIPELAAQHLTPPQKRRLRQFANPVPVRQVSLIMHEHFPRKQVVQALKTNLLACALPMLRHGSNNKTIPVAKIVV